jgi:hypothetical protein
MLYVNNQLEIDQKHTTLTMLGVIKSWRYFDDEPVGDEKVSDTSKSKKKHVYLT